MVQQAASGQHSNPSTQHRLDACEQSHPLKQDWFGDLRQGALLLSFADTPPAALLQLHCLCSHEGTVQCSFPGCHTRCGCVRREG